MRLLRTETAELNRWVMTLNKIVLRCAGDCVGKTNNWIGTNWLESTMNVGSV